MAQVSHLRLSEGALLHICIELMLSKKLQDLPQMLAMLLWCLTVDEDVI